MKKIIVNADDYGLCPGVNEGILTALEAGKVTDFSFMIDARTFGHSADTLRGRDIGSCGLHINLTAGRSLRDNREFPGLRSLVIGLCTGRVTPADLLREIDFQMDTLREAGLEITHIDSHQNVHLLPFLFSHIKERLGARGAQIPIRIPQESPFLPPSALAGNFARLVTLNALSLIPRLSYKPAVQVVGQFFYANSDRMAAVDRVAAYVTGSAKALFEFPVHPGLCNCESVPECADPYTTSRSLELSALMMLDGYFEEKGIEKVSFADVAPLA